MDQEPDVIRQNIDETRSSLTEKLETLEGQVRDTVQGARATVENTIESVKRTFDLPYQVRQHPWPMVGGSILAGFLAGSFAGRRPGPRGERPSSSGRAFGALSSSYREQESSSTARPDGVSGTAPAKQSLVNKFLDQFDDEIGKVKEVAIGAAAAVVREWIKSYLPPNLRAQVDEVANSATSKLGGKPVSGRVI